MSELLLAELEDEALALLLEELEPLEDDADALALALAFELELTSTSTDCCCCCCWLTVTVIAWAATGKIAAKIPVPKTINNLFIISPAPEFRSKTGRKLRKSTKVISICRFLRSGYCKRLNVGGF